MRIAVGGLSTESNGFSPVFATMDSFSVIRGEDLYHEFPALPQSQLEGSPELYWTPALTLRQMSVDVAPTIFARAYPRGPVEKSAYLILKEELLQGIRQAGKIDGVCLVLHGAMIVEEIGSAELDLSAAVRKLVGPEILISASFDLHGNIPTELARYINIATAHKQFPHYDYIETRKRAAMLLVEALEKGLRPKLAIVKPPMILPGEYVPTNIEPGAGLYRKLLDLPSGIMDSSLFVGFWLADAPYVGATAMAVAEGEEYLDEAYMKAREIAVAYWENRYRFGLEVESGSPDEVVRAAKASRIKPFFICDTGDNISAGGLGNSTVLIEELLAQGVDDAVVGGFIDAEAVKACREAGLGRMMHLKLGSGSREYGSKVIEVVGRVVNLTENSAVFQIGSIDVILTSGIVPFRSPECFQFHGINPSERGIIVVKLGQLFPRLERIASRTMMALTPGLADFRLEKFNYNRIVRPTFPLDKDFEWDGAAFLGGTE